MEIKNRGLNWEQHQADMKDERNYVFGAVQNKIVLEPDGQYLDYLPMAEMQHSDKVDWMDCVSESLTNVKKVLKERLFNITEKDSVRFLAEMSGTTTSGNSLYKVAGTERNNGYVSKSVWPRDNTMDWNTYYCEIPNIIKTLGEKNAQDFEFSYEQVPTTPEAMKQALTFGPLQVIGYAWMKRQDGLYDDFGYNPNHAFTVCGYVDGQYWIVYDSYPESFDNTDTNPQDYIKHLAWDFKFGDVLLHSIKLKNKKKDQSLINNIKNMITTLFSWFDNHGLHIAYVPKNSAGKVIGKQVIDLSGAGTIMTVLLKCMYDAEMFKKSSYGEVSSIPDLSPEKMIR